MAERSLADDLARSPLEVAPRLLGATLSAHGVTVRLTEVEAYAGPDDPGSHAFRRTARSEVMYGAPGRLYCYFVYGMHVCANVVTGPPGTGGAVLLRAGEVVAGLDRARDRRPGASDRELARGPARLCRTLAIDLACNDTDLETGPVRLVLAPVPVPPERVGSGPRVGLREAADRPWRHWILGEPSVSPYRPAGPRRRRVQSPDPSSAEGPERAR